MRVSEPFRELFEVQEVLERSRIRPPVRGRRPQSRTLVRRVRRRGRASAFPIYGQLSITGKTHRSRLPSDHRTPFGHHNACLGCTPETREEAGRGVYRRGRAPVSGRETLAHVDGVGARTFWWMVAVGVRLDRKRLRLKRRTIATQSSDFTTPNPKAVREGLPNLGREKCRSIEGRGRLAGSNKRLLVWSQGCKRLWTREVQYNELAAHRRGDTSVGGMGTKSHV